MPDFRNDVRARVAPFGLDPVRESRLVDEIAQHLDDAYAEHLGHGLDDASARAAALGELAGIERFAPELRRRAPAQLGLALGRTHGSWVETILHDARYALRGLRAHPAFSAVAVATFAIGIGACTLMFGAVQGVLRRPLPFHDPDQVVAFFGTAPERGLPEVNMPTGMFELFRRETRTLESLTAFTSIGGTLTGNFDPERIEGAVVSREFFATLGVPPRRGRGFVEGEDVPNVPQSVVISHGLWQRRFAGDTALVGRAIQLFSRPATVVGIMPPGFDYPQRAEFWIPLVIDGPDNFNCWCYQLVGRAKPGFGAPDVAREMATIADDFGLRRRDVFPDAKKGGARFVAMPVVEKVAGDLQRPLWVLLGAVGLVLLIGCANIANLVLVRATARQQELAMRCCLGAGPGRIAAQLLTESLVLAGTGAVAGLALAWWGMRAMRRLPPEQFPRMAEVGIDPVVLAFTAGIAVLTGLLCGVAPALRVRRLQLHDAVRSGARGTSGGGMRRWSNGFVVTQFALSLVLLVGAGLLLRSYDRLSRVDLGYEPESVLTGRLALPFARYDTTAKVRAFYESLIERVRSVPGVSEVGISSRIPLSRGNPQNNVMAEGQEIVPGKPTRVTNIRVVSPGFFRAMGTPIVEGRDFQPSDDERGMRVAVVDEAFARYFWPNESAIGKRVRGPSNTSANRWVTIVGVVRNVKHNSLDEETDIQMYEPFPRFTQWSNYLVVRSDLPAGDLSARIRAELKALDPLLPFYEVRTMTEYVRRSLSVRRLTNLLLLGFALTALVLAAIGIYGVISLSVGARVREFGVRMALGATGTDIGAMVLRYGLGLAAVGVALGAAGAWYLTRFIQKLLFGVEPFDTATVLVVAAVLGATALVASWVPARRATRADPVLALRSD